MVKRSSGRVAAADKADKEKNRTAFDVVAKKFKRSRSKHLEELESSNFGMLRGAAEAIIAGSGAADDDAAAEVIGKKAKKTRTGRTEQAMSKKPLGQILYESEFQEWPPWVPNYMNTATEMPDEPPRQFCAICGNKAPYTCTKCGVRFCKGRCYNTHCETRCIRY